jgi:hypothetical protein
MQKSTNAQTAFHRLGGLDIVTDLQLSQYHEIYKTAQEILEQFCGGTEMTELEKMEFMSSKDQVFKV